MIELSRINKSFRVARRAAGLKSAAKALFSRQYDTIHALTDISFSVAEGEMVGYIGPNGAGKSTTIKIMCGILTPDSGSCTISGLTPWRQRKRHVSEIGVVFGQRSQLWWDVPVCDSFELIRDIYNVPERPFRARLSEMTELLELSEILKTPARTLSLGQRMRCEIAASLLHSPKILFLDEPTIGLDAVSKIAVRGFIRQINAQHKTTVILTTHDMQDIEALTPRILLIGKGRILLDGSLSELQRRASAGKTLVLDYSGPAPALHEYMTLIDSRPSRLTVGFDPARLPISQAISHLSAQTDVQDISVSGLSAERMVAGLYKEYGI